MPFAAISAGLGVVSGVASIFGGINASNEAAAANDAAEEAAEEARELAERDAEIQNRYNKEVFEAEKKDYFAQREFDIQTALKQWEYGKQIQDFNFKQAQRRYSQSVENFNDQLGFNRIAADDAYRSEQAALNDFITQQAFTKEGAMIDMLQKQGTAQAGQAGKSRNKAVSATIGEYGRNMSILAESLLSNVRQTDRNFRDIARQKYGADLTAKSRLIIEPENAPYAPKPELGPERTFVEPREILPGFTQPYIPRSTSAPLISGLTQGFGSLAGVDWSAFRPSNPG